MAYLGEDTPKLGFGLMRLPKNEDGTIDIDHTSQMVDEFLAAGCTYFDTARAYGESESATRRALVERHPRDSYTLATKCAAWLGANNADEAKAFFETSLEQTGAGYFDYYLLHNLGGKRTQIYDDWGLWDWVRGLKEGGKIRHYGFSFHDTADVLDQILDAHPDAEFVQLQINYVDWENASVQSRACYEVARAHGKPVVIMEPVKGGTLANPPEPVAQILREALPDRNPVEWALRFAMSLDGLMTVLSGMSNIEQVRQNLDILKGLSPLTQVEQDALEAARAKARRPTTTVPRRRSRPASASSAASARAPARSTSTSSTSSSAPPRSSSRGAARQRGSGHLVPSMISLAISRRVTQRSIACFSMKRWAAGSSMPRSEMRIHLARLTRRISDIFSSMESVRPSRRTSRSDAACIQPRARASRERAVGLGKVNTPKPVTLALTSS